MVQPDLPAAGSRPHHVHASVGGQLIAVGLFGTDTVAVVDTRDDTLLGPWDSNPATTNGRMHAGRVLTERKHAVSGERRTSEVIAMDPRTGTVLWRMPVPGAHELAVTHDGKTAFVSRRTLTGSRSSISKTRRSPTRMSSRSVCPTPCELSANEKLLTVGLRTSPAQVAVVDTRTFGPPQIVTLSGR